MTYLKHHQPLTKEFNADDYEPSELLDKHLKLFDQNSIEIKRLEMAIENVHKYKHSNPKILKSLYLMLDRKQKNLMSTRSYPIF